MEPFLSKDGKTLITYEDVVITTYSIRVIDATDRNKIVGDTISLDGYIVELNEYEKKYLDALRSTNKIPALYTVRIKESHRFVCGFDINGNDEYWVGIGDRPWFKTIAEAIAYLEEEVKEPFYISLEEAMPL
jgi:hypothetical protein